MITKILGLKIKNVKSSFSEDNVSRRSFVPRRRSRIPYLKSPSNFWLLLKTKMKFENFKSRPLLILFSKLIFDKKVLVGLVLLLF